jgi:PPOX class probable F420-dependent enzyme
MYTVGSLSEAQASLFKGKNFAALGTIRADGTPHVSPVWVDYDGEHVIFNTSRGRAKEQQVGRDPRVTLTVWSAESPYEYVEVSGTAEFVDEGATDHIDAMAKKYLGQDTYPWLQPGERRVIVKVTPVKVTGMK